MNLHQSIGKTNVTKILASLQERGLIYGKTYGKSVIYVARQDDRPAPSPEELESIDCEITALSSQLVTQREATRQVQNRKLNCVPIRHPFSP